MIFKGSDFSINLIMSKTINMQTQYDIRILSALRRITRAIAVHSRQLAAYSNVTAPQLICLGAIVENGPITATAISRKIHVSPSTVVDILDRLEDKGWIRRERGKEDRRIVFITATEAGIELVRATPSPIQTKLTDALKDLPETEQAAITTSLEKIVMLMEAHSVVAHEVSNEPASPILDVPVTDAQHPESGILI